MEYHSDQFRDFSLLVYSQSILIAVFPANIIDNRVHSHQGLTYGGLILRNSLGGEKIKNLISDIIDFMKVNDVSSLFVKSIPIFYNKKPANEFTFFLSEYGGKIYRRDLNLAIDYSLPSSIHKSKLKHYEKKNI